jgi:hypothetical protein
MKKYFIYVIGVFLILIDLLIIPFIEQLLFSGSLSKFRFNLWLNTTYKFSEFISHKYLDIYPAGYIEFIEEGEKE